MKKQSRGIGISHASFCYLTNGAQLLFSSAFRFWFQIVFQIVLASFVPGLNCCVGDIVQINHGR